MGDGAFWASCHAYCFFFDHADWDIQLGLKVLLQEYNNRDLLALLSIHIGWCGGLGPAGQHDPLI